MRRFIILAMILGLASFAYAQVDTETYTQTATRTATNTITGSVTRTFTRTPTNTRTPVNTRTFTSTRTETRTRTNTRTFTPTFTPTNTPTPKNIDKTVDFPMTGWVVVDTTAGYKSVTISAVAYNPVVSEVVVWQYFPKRAGAFCVPEQNNGFFGIRIVDSSNNPVDCSSTTVKVGWAIFPHNRLK